MSVLHDPREWLDEPGQLYIDPLTLMYSTPL